METERDALQALWVIRTWLIPLVTLDDDDLAIYLVWGPVEITVVPGLGA